MGKFIVKKLQGKYLLALTLTIFCTLPVYAQNGKLPLNSLDDLKSKASDVADISLEGSALKLALGYLSNSKVAKEKDTSKIKDIVKGLQGVYVRSFEFEQENAYSDKDLEEIRTKLRGSGWSKMVNVQSKKDRESVEIFAMVKGEARNVTALAIIAAEPKELVVINLIGNIDLSKLSSLQGNFGIPDLDLPSE